MPKNASRAIILTTVAALSSSVGVSAAAAGTAADSAIAHVAPATATTAGQASTAATVPPAVRFNSKSWLYRNISRAPVARNSKAMVADLQRQIYGRYNGVAAVNAYQYNASFYTVSRSTPRQTVQFDDCQGKGYVPDGLFNGRKNFVNVPIPAGAVPATGTDGNLTIYSPSTNQLWELWVASKISGTNRWKACWGGRLDYVSTSRWASFPSYYGCTATGISIAGTMVTVAEARKRQINHAIYMAIPEPKMYTSYSWPARRSDGFSTNPNAIPEGTILRLDPKVNVDALKLTPFAKAVAKAAQKYGFVVADKAGAVNISTESGAAEKARTGKDPWKAIFGSTPDYEQLRNFPWNRVQALPMNYGKNAK